MEAEEEVEVMVVGILVDMVAMVTAKNSSSMVEVTVSALVCLWQYDVW